MSLIEILKPCACGRCDAYTEAVRCARNVHSDAMWRGGMRAHRAHELADIVVHDSLFWMGHTPFERRTA